MIERVEKQLNTQDKLAALISAIVNPVFVVIFVACEFVFFNLNSWADTFRWMGITLGITAVLPIGYIAYLVKTGYLADIYMPDREKRLKPMVVIFSWLVVSLFILRLLHAPPVMLLLVDVIIGQLVLLGLITTRWKISFHSATIMSATAVMAVIHSESVLILSALVPVVGWARIRLKRHTLMQVVAGAIVGGVISAIAFLFLMQKFHW